MKFIFKVLFRNDEMMKNGVFRRRNKTKIQLMQIMTISHDQNRLH